MSIDNYNPEKVDFYLKCIDSTNQKAEQRIERIRKNRDKQVDTYQLIIEKEKLKPE